MRLLSLSLILYTCACRPSCSSSAFAVTSRPASCRDVLILPGGLGGPCNCSSSTLPADSCKQHKCRVRCGYHITMLIGSETAGASQFLSIMLSTGIHVKLHSMTGRRYTQLRVCVVVVVGCCCCVGSASYLHDCKALAQLVVQQGTCAQMQAVSTAGSKQLLRRAPAQGGWQLSNLQGCRAHTHVTDMGEGLSLLPACLVFVAQSWIWRAGVMCREP